MNLFELSAKITADTTGFERAIKSAQKESTVAEKNIKALDVAISKANSTFKKMSSPIGDASEEMEDFGASTKSLKTPLDSLSNKISEASSKISTHKNRMDTLIDNYRIAKGRVSDLTREFNEAARSTGTLSDKTKKLAKQLDEAEEEAGEAKRQLSDFSGKTQDASKKFDVLGASVNIAGNIISSVANFALSAISVAFEVAAAAAGTFLATLTALSVQAIKTYSDFEQLAGGAAKIFDEMDQESILRDASRAYKDLNISANQYLSVINDVGATFASTMGDAAGYETARKGLLAISDYASGTGKSVDELSGKFTLITRSTSSYQSIADQFSGILPATSAGFLEQAQSVGLLSEKYKELTAVPIAEYQSAVAGMLEIGVKNLGLAGNTAAEANSTISGSIASTKSAWEDLMVSFVNGGSDFEGVAEKFFNSAAVTASLVVPKIASVLKNASPFIEGAIKFVVEEMPQGIKDGLPSIVDATIEIINTIADAMVENQDVIVGAVESLFEFLASKMSTETISVSALSLVGRLLLTMVNAITASAPVLIKAMADLMLDLSTAPEAKENIEAAVESAAALIEAIGVAVLEASPTIISAMFEIIGDTISVLTEEDTIMKIGDAVKELVGAIGNAILNNNKTTADSITTIIEEMAQKVKDFDWEDAGEDVIDSIKTGISNAWGGLKDWFNGIWGSLFNNRNINVNFGGIGKIGVNGSHESGLRYVPFDGYIAELHKGERVLTSEESRRYNSASIENLTINIDGSKYDDEETLAMVIAEKIQNMTQRKGAVYA